jgi:hypothetical protein
VGRLIDEVINAGRLDIIDEIYTPQMAPAARRWISPFRVSFPDVDMEVVDLIAEGEKVVGRLRCSATNLGLWRGKPPPAAASSASTRSTSSASTTAASPKPGASTTPAHANDSSATRASHATARSVRVLDGPRCGLILAVLRRLKGAGLGVDWGLRNVGSRSASEPGPCMFSENAS